MRRALLVLELFVSIFLTCMGAMFVIMEITAAGPARLGQVAFAAAVLFVGLALGGQAFRGLRTRGLLVAGAVLFGLTALGGILALVRLGVAVWLVAVVVGLLGVLACYLRLKGLG